MLDVDGQVVGAQDLIDRVDHLLARIEAGRAVPGALEPEGLTGLVAPVHGMRLLHGMMHPPEVNTGTGVSGRLASLMKRVVRRTTNWYVEPRFQIQEEMGGLSVDFASEVYNAIHRMEAEIKGLRSENVRVHLELVTMAERLRMQQIEVERAVSVAIEVQKLVLDAASQEELSVVTKEIAAVFDRLGIQALASPDLDYVEFERRFRGNGTEIADAQRRYLTLFPPPTMEGVVIDIGCGRGEMLRILADAGHEVSGVDMDAGMVQACLDQGLPAQLGNGLHVLSRTPDDSLKGVFCAQVVEHLLTTEMEALVRGAYRALRVDGVLVIETINPRSSFALGNHFYADTSHTRPVHPETLRFICEQVGFSEVQLEERSPHPSLDQRQGLPDDAIGEAVRSLLESVFGYQDYVIVATK